MSDQRVEVQLRRFINESKPERRATRITFVGSDHAETSTTARAVRFLERHASEMLRIVQNILEAAVVRRTAEHRRRQLDPRIRTRAGLSFAAEYSGRMTFRNHQLGERICSECQQRDHNQHDQQHAAAPRRQTSSGGRRHGRFPRSIGLKAQSHSTRAYRHSKPKQDGPAFVAERRAVSEFISSYQT